jgi:hypothetical protein
VPSRVDISRKNRRDPICHAGGIQSFWLAPNLAAHSNLGVARNVVIPATRLPGFQSYLLSDDRPVRSHCPVTASMHARIDISGPGHGEGDREVLWLGSGWSSLDVGEDVRWSSIAAGGGSCLAERDHDNRERREGYSSREDDHTKSPPEGRLARDGGRSSRGLRPHVWRVDSVEPSEPLG